MVVVRPEATSTTGQAVSGIAFVLQCGEQWINAGVVEGAAHDFFVPIPSGPMQRLAAEAAAAGPSVVALRLFSLGKGGRAGHLLAVLRKAEGGEPLNVDCYTDASEALVLHWGLSRRNGAEWVVPPAALCPPNSLCSAKSCETPFAVRRDSPGLLQNNGRELPPEELIIALI